MQRECLKDTKLTGFPVIAGCLSATLPGTNYPRSVWRAISFDIRHLITRMRFRPILCDPESLCMKHDLIHKADLSCAPVFSASHEKIWGPSGPELHFSSEKF